MLANKNRDAGASGSLSTPVPVNTSSLRRENKGQDISVPLVPSGGVGWGANKAMPPPPVSFWRKSQHNTAVLSVVCLSFFSDGDLPCRFLTAAFARSSKYVAVSRHRVREVAPPYSMFYYYVRLCVRTVTSPRNKSRYLHREQSATFPQCSELEEGEG